jgi:hypothetical protein
MHIVVSLLGKSDHIAVLLLVVVVVVVLRLLSSTLLVLGVEAILRWSKTLMEVNNIVVIDDNNGSNGKIFAASPPPSAAAVVFLVVSVEFSIVRAFFSCRPAPLAASIFPSRELFSWLQEDTTQNKTKK